MPGQRFSDGKSRVSQAGRQVVVSPAMQLPATPARLGLPGWPGLAWAHVISPLSPLSISAFAFKTFTGVSRAGPGRA